MENNLADKELILRAIKYLDNRSISTEKVKGHAIIKMQNEVIPKTDVMFVLNQLMDGDLPDFFDKVNKYLKEIEKF